NSDPNSNACSLRHSRCNRVDVGDADVIAAVSFARQRYAFPQTTRDDGRISFMTEVTTDVSTNGGRRGLIAGIASIKIVGIRVSAVAPLLPLNLERRDVGLAWNGLLAAMPPLATLIFGIFMPMIIRRIGAASAIYLGAGASAIALLLFPV